MANTDDDQRPKKLDGCHILIVEDEFLIALEIERILEEAGADVVGPAHSMSSAVTLCENEGLSAAVLDLRLGDDTVAPVARRLTARNVPFLFYTGQTSTDPLRDEWPHSVVLSKPARPGELVAALARLLHRNVPPVHS